MKDQYFGDINDYFKYGLIRSILRAGKFRLLVAWMLTCGDKKPDGNRRLYLAQPNKWRKYDSELYDRLQGLPKDYYARKVSLLEQTNLLPKAMYYSRKLKDDRNERSSWTQELIVRAHNSDLVFLDPDNGIEVPSKPCGRQDSSKYLYWREVEKLWENGKSLLIYQHFCREERKPFICRILDELRNHTPGSIVEAFSTPHVIFFLVLQPEHQKHIPAIIDNVQDNWGSQIQHSELNAPLQTTPSDKMTGSRGIVDKLGRRSDTMTAAISLIYGEQVMDDLAFCTKHQRVIERYSHAIMTLNGSPLNVLESVALDPASVPGWTDSLKIHPEDYAILQDFFSRLIRQYIATGQSVASCEGKRSGIDLH